MPVLSKEKKKEVYKNMSEWERNFLLEYMLNKYSVDIYDNRDGENKDLPSKVVVLVKSKTGKIIYQSVVEQ
ncbi:hypothetical protein ACFLR4_00295 [Bacteroidota bacterium]